MRDLLQPLVKQILSAESMDLESDPIAIYRSLIREEESRTGEKSSRPYDVTAAVAAQDPGVQKVQAGRTFSSFLLIRYVNLFLFPLKFYTKLSSR